MKCQSLLFVMGGAWLIAPAYAGSVLLASQCDEKAAPSGCQYRWSESSAKCVLRCTSMTKKAPVVVGGGGGSVTSGALPTPPRPKKEGPSFKDKIKLKDSAVKEGS
jgi:hypothetical protein